MRAAAGRARRERVQPAVRAVAVVLAGRRAELSENPTQEKALILVSVISDSYRRGGGRAGTGARGSTGWAQTTAGSSAGARVQARR